MPGFDPAFPTNGDGWGTAMVTDLRALARALGGEVRDGQVFAPGPGHSPIDRSLSVKLDGSAPDGFLVHSFASDDAIVCRDHVRDKLNLPAFKPNGHRKQPSEDDITSAVMAAVMAQGHGGSKPKGKIVAIYDYTEADGSLLYQNVRYEPKDFRQRRPDGNGGHIWNLDGVRRVPYRWPELIAYPDATVFVCEGEKDTDNVCALDLTATTVASGKWTQDCVDALTVRDCWILQDVDINGAGDKKAHNTAKHLHGVAKSIKIVCLPGLTGDPGNKDVSDWLEQGHSKDELIEVCASTPDWAPGDASKADNKGADAETKNTEQPDFNAYFTFLGDAPAAPPQELIKGLLPAFGIAVTGGQSTAGKTFIKIYKSICLATALPYFGRRIVERVGTVFVPAEGRALIPNRFAATLRALSITKKLPVAWVKSIPDFSSSDGIKLFIRELVAINKYFVGEFGVRLGHVPIDTVAACFSIKDEDDNAEATKTCNILLRIGEEIGALMAPVHHYGKNPESGLRGASAWKGSADVVEGVLADVDPLSGRTSNRELVCTKARDGEQGPISPFELRWIKLGINPDDGEDYGSMYVMPTEGKSRADKATKVNKTKLAITEAINEVMDNGNARIITPRAGMATVKAVRVSDVRPEFYRRYVVDETEPAKMANAKRMAFKRALDHLSVSEFGAGSAEGADWVWKVS